MQHLLQLFGSLEIALDQMPLQVQPPDTYPFDHHEIGYCGTSTGVLAVCDYMVLPLWVAMKHCTAA